MHTIRTRIITFMAAPLAFAASALAQPGPPSGPPAGPPTAAQKAQALPMPSAAEVLKVGKPSGPQGLTWAEIAQLPDLSSTKWSNAPGGAPFGGNCEIKPGTVRNPYSCMKQPWTPEWQTKFDAVKKVADAGGDVPSRIYKCIPNGYSGNLGSGFDGLLEILMTPGQVTIIPESWQGRRIYTNGRKHPEDPDTTFSGDNVGHWENGTLVVDTIALDPGIEITYGIPGGTKMHVVQKISMLDDHTIMGVSALEAPEALTAPRVTRNILVRNTKWEMHEQYCSENNKDVNSDGTQQFDLTPPPLPGE